MSASADARRQIMAAKHPVIAARKLQRSQPRGVKRFGDVTAPEDWTEIAGPAARDAAIRHNEFLQDPSPEAVHEMRRALRRIRAILLVFAEEFPRADADLLLKEVKWMTRQFGPLRDLDVLQLTLRSETSFTLQTIEEDALIGVIMDERRAAETKCLAAATSARATLLLAGLSPWLESRSQPPEGDAMLADYVRDRLREEDAALLQKGRRLGSMGQAKRHRLRSKVKMLRYALEAMPWLCPTEDPYRVALQELHSVLGDLNDHGVGKRLLTRMCADHQVGEPHHQRIVAVEDGRTRLAAAWLAFEEAPADWLYDPGN